MLKVYKVLDGLDTAIRALIFVLIAVMVFSTGLQVLGRYVLVVPFPWTEELSRRMMTWLLFSASAIGYRRGGMVGVDIVTRNLSEATKKKLDIIIFGMIAFFGVFMMVQGYDFATRMVRQLSAALGISMFYVYIIIPFSGFLFLVFSIELIIKRISGYKKEEPTGNTESSPC